MRITCPLCGPRDRREFYYYGDAVWLDRPGVEAAPEAWHDYIHLRDNPAPALHIVEENGTQARLTYAELSARSNQASADSPARQAAHSR